MTNSRTVLRLQWFSDRLSDGTYYALAWIAEVDSQAEPFATTQAPTDAEALEALRVAICKQFRLPIGSRIVNDDGCSLNPLFTSLPTAAEVAARFAAAGESDPFQ